MECVVKGCLVAGCVVRVQLMAGRVCVCAMWCKVRVCEKEIEKTICCGLGGL